uniref:Uncharacterized protein n=1 Tax=Terrapene triunguis TaxID=2587831 RepID=A0A674J6I4_9SAUR
GAAGGLRGGAMAALAGPGAGTPGSGARDLFAEGLLEFLRPAARQLDSRVHAVRCLMGEA